MATMLALVQQVYAELGTRTVPTAVASSTDVDVIQVLALMNAVGYELQREHQWQALTIEYRFTTSYLSTTGTWTTAAATVTSIPTTAALAAGSWMVASGTGVPTDTYIQSVDSGTQVTLTQTPTIAGTAATIVFAKTKYPLPTDYDRLVDGTQWDKTSHWQLVGPETMQQKNWLKSGYISTGPRVRYYLQGNTFQVWPPLTTSEYLGFDYVSNYWVTATGGTAPTKTAFTVDTDTCVFPDRLMVLGTKLKYFEIRGFDTTALYRDYTKQLDIAKAAEAGNAMLSMAPRQSEVLLGYSNIPDSNYGS